MYCILYGVVGCRMRLESLRRGAMGLAYVYYECLTIWVSKHGINRDGYVGFVGRHRPETYAQMR